MVEVRFIAVWLFSMCSLLSSIFCIIKYIYFYDFSLELAYKDAIKKDSLYEKVINLLMGLYYFYKNSPKMRKCLKRLCKKVYKVMFLVPTRVGGTRWVAHLLRAVKHFLHMYQAIRHQMEDILSQKSGKV